MKYLLENQLIHHLNRIRDNTHMTISEDTEKTFDKTYINNTLVIKYYNN